jgi:signal transduction histidine kinase/ligand-binding sensor domain-containing protein
LRALGLCLAGLLLGSPAWSLQSDLTLQQLNHKGWTAANGAPSAVVALAQTPDGTLWIGSEMGLFRFDGLSFVRYAGPPDQPFESNNVSTLATSPDGGLWIGFRFGDVGVLKDGRFTHYGKADGLPDGTVKSIVWDDVGTTWVAARGGLARLRGSRWERVTIGTNDLSPYGALVDRSGTLWVLAPDRVLARARGAIQFREIATRTYAPNGPHMALGVAPDGAVWTSDAGGLMRMDPPASPHSSGNRVFPNVAEGPLLFDREGNLWLGSETVRRVSRNKQLADPRDLGVTQPEAFGKSDGLTSSRVTCLFEDREGNLWAGTTLGLDRFSDSKVVRLALPRTLSLTDPVGGPVIVPGHGNAMWVALRTKFPAALLLRVRRGRVVAQQPAPDFSSAYRDPDGTAWFGGPTALAHIEGTRLVTQALPAQAWGSDVQAIVRDGTGAMWVSVIRKGVFRFLDGQWLAYGGLQALPRETPIVEVDDQRGGLWFGYTHNRIARVDGTVVRLFGVADGIKVGNVTAIAGRRAHVWIGGELGLARFDGSHFVSVQGTSDNSFTGITGIVETEGGDLWLHGNKGVLHLSPDEVEQVVRDTGHRVRYEAFDYLDGLPGTAVQLRPLPSAVETPNGALWFVTTNGLASIVSTRIHRNTLPPPVTIWSVTAGGRRYPVTSAGLRLPVHTSKLQIEYTAGSLTIPERVHFRYKLDGSDNGWQDTGGRREAFYTNLAPGEYSFHVTASNDDGVWNPVGASLKFTITPAFYQTTWFRLVCGFVCLFLLWRLYDYRIAQIRAKVRGRLEVRLAERERIARDLHDTLLQGVEGLVLRFQAVANRIARREPVGELLERALERADQVLEEGRDRVMNLREGAGDVGDLAQALAAAGEQLALMYPVEFRASVEGVARDLHPIVREELLFIGREALANAFRHASASMIEVEVSYGDRTLKVRVRDDGRGIDAEVVRNGRPGHWGLPGIRERARNIRAGLEVWSRPGAGTEIELSLQAELAYRGERCGARRSWWRLGPPLGSIGRCERLGDVVTEHE